MRKLVTLLALLLIFLTACNQTSEIKITFIENGGVELEDMTIKTTDTSIELPTPVRDGFTFDGWFTDEDLTLPFTIASLLTQSGGITLYAKWTEIINSFIVTFETNGGSAISNVTYEAGTTIVAPTDPTKVGYTFAGWYSDQALETAYTFGPMPEANLTLYAKWTINTYTITFESNGGSAVTSLSGDYQQAITKPTNPTKTGYTFVDWYIDANLTTPYVFTLMGSSNLTLYAKWTVNQYTVSFETNNGSIVPSVTIDYNTLITAPTEPTKVGYSFGGWYSDQTLTTAYVFTSPVVASMTLYAKWNINSYTMTFVTNGGSPVNPITQNFGSPITIPNTAKEGYDFAGWYSNIELTTIYTIGTMPSNNITLYAKWTASPYTITFNSNGGSLVTTISANYNDVVTKPVDPTKLGYTFVDWYRDEALQTVFVFNTMPVGGATLYAKWQVNTYTITFVTNGGTAIEPLNALYDSVIAAPTTTKAGYTFEGWYLEDTFTTAYTFNKMGSSNLTLYAKWTAIQYSITFVSNGGTEVTSISGIIDQIITKPTDPTKQGYTFLGWYKETDFQTLFVFDKMPLNGQTVYAKWKVNSYTLTYVIAGSTINDEIAYQGQITLMDGPVIEGYTFVGWLENDVPFTLTTMPDRDLTLVPKYEINYYTISFSNIDKEDMSLKYNDPISLSEPTKTGYEFVGWYSDDFLLNEFVETTMPANNIVLYAKFEPLEVMLYLHIDELEIIPITLGYDYYYMPETPEKEGYQFLGWYLEDTFVNRVYDVVMGLDPIHLYAKWQIDEGYELIETILMTKPTEPVLVKGIISYIFERVGFPGFYLYDGTASIFVLASSAPFVVGDVIEFEATYDNFENTPQLINPVNMMVSTGTYDLPETAQMDLEGVLRLDESDPFVYGKRVTLEAFLGFMNNTYFLQAPFSEEKVIINYRSLVNDQILLPYVGQTVRLDVFIHDYQGMAQVWHVAYISETINTVTYTPEEIIDQMIALGVENLEGKVFYPGATLELPTVDPTYGTTLDWSVVGENSAFFDISTFTFLDTDIERQIGLQCVVTYQGTSETAVFTVILKPVTFMTYEQFLALEMNGYAMIKGIVLAHIPMIPATIVALDGNPILVPNNTPLNPGDEAVFIGYKQQEMGMLILANDPNVVLVEVTQTGLPMPEATNIPIETFVTLPGDDPMYWFKYVQVTGMLQFDSSSGFYFIVSAPNAIPLLPLSPTANQKLSQYVGMPVTITGFTVMNFDVGGQLHLGYLDMPGDIVVAELTPEEKVDAVLYQLLSQFMHTFYHPGETINFPTTDPFFNSTITFTHVNDSANYINLETGLVSEQIQSFIAVEILVTITCDGITKALPLFIHIQPSLPMVNISQLQMMPITDVTMMVQVATEPINGWMLIWDGMNYMGLYSTRNDVHKGDMIQVQGRLSDIDDNNFIGNMGDPIIQIISIGNPDGSYKSPMSATEFMNRDFNIIQNQYLGVELTGIVVYDDTISEYYIVSAGTVIYIRAVTLDGMFALKDHIGIEVTLGGYLVHGQTANELLFYNEPNDLVVFIDETTIVENARLAILEEHDKIYRPGETALLNSWMAPYYPSIYYVLISDVSLYDTWDQTISSDITEPTLIQFEVSISYGEYSIVFDLFLTVEPLVFSTVAEIKAAQIGSELNLEAIVLFNSYDATIPFLIVGDSTGFLVISGKHWYDIYDKVQFTGLLIDYQGEPALQVEAYQTLLVSNYNTPETQPIPMTLYEATQVDALDPLFTYIMITGTIKREPTGFVLYDENTLEEVYFADIDEHSVFNEFIGLKVTLAAFITYSDSKGAPILYYSGGHGGIELGYDTDAEKMAALIARGSEHFEGRTYHPFEYIDMPTYYDVFDAYLSYEILSGSEYLVDGDIQYTETEVTISLQITVLIGTLEEVVVYTITIQPYPITSIIDVSLNNDNDFVVVKGTVRAVYDYQMIIEDATGMIILEGFSTYPLGTVILVYGYVNYVYGTVQLHGYGELALSAEIGTDTTLPTLSNISLYETLELDPNGANLAFYTTYSGLIENRQGTFYITNGLVSVQLLEANDDAHQALLLMEQEIVSINVYFNGFEMYGDPYITAIFNGLPTEYEIIQLTDEEIATEMLNYALSSFNHPYYTEQTYNYPIEHPHFLGLIEVTNDGVYNTLVTFNQGLATVAEITTSVQTDITITVTYAEVTMSDTLTITLSPFPIITLQEAMTNHLGELVFLKVMITSMQYHYDTFVYVQDSTGLAYYITWNTDVHPYTGYEVIISGYVFEPAFNISYMDQVTLVEVLGPVTPPTPTNVMISDLVLNNEINVNLLGELITFTGLVQDMGYEIIVVGPNVQVVLLGNVQPEYQNLALLNGQMVEITGVLVGYYVDYMTQQVIPNVGYIPLT